MKWTTKQVAVTLALLFVAGGIAFAAQDAEASAGSDFDFHKLWQGALAGLGVTLVRAWSKGTKPKEFDWKWLLVYAGFGILGGAYAAWRGLDFKDVFDWAEQGGVIMILYALLKGGKVNVLDVVLRLLAAKGNGQKPPTPPEEPSSGNPT